MRSSGCAVISGALCVHSLGVMMTMMNLWMSTLVMTTDYSRMRSQSGMIRKRTHRHTPGFRYSHPLYQTQSLPLTRTLPKMNSRLISSYVAPADCPVNSSIFVPSLLHGDTAQGFWTASSFPQTIRSGSLVNTTSSVTRCHA